MRTRFLLFLALVALAPRLHAGELDRYPQTTDGMAFAVRSLVGQLRQYVEAGDRSVTDLQTKQAECVAAGGQGAACDEAARLQVELGELKAVVRERVAQVQAAVGRLQQISDTEVGQVRARIQAEVCTEPCFLCFLSRSKADCEADKTRRLEALDTQQARILEQHGANAPEAIAAATAKMQAWDQAAGAATTAISGAQQASAAALDEFRAEVNALSPEALAEAITRCHRNAGEENCDAARTEIYREFYEKRTAVTLQAGQLPPVRTFEEACKWWGGSHVIPVNPFKDVCSEEWRATKTEDEVRQTFENFLKNGPGSLTFHGSDQSGRSQCDPQNFHCLAPGVSLQAPGGIPAGTTRDDVGDAAAAMPSPEDEEAKRRNAVAFALSRTADIECSGGGSSLLGQSESGFQSVQGAECGAAGTLGPDAGAADPGSLVVAAGDRNSTDLNGRSTDVVKGDTVGDIGAKVLRQMGRTDLPLWPKGGVAELIAHANGIDINDYIHPDQGLRIPTRECLAEAASVGGAAAFDALDSCEKLVQVTGNVPANLSVMMQITREKIAKLEASGVTLSAQDKQEILMDSLNAANNSGDFVDPRSRLPAAADDPARVADRERFVETQVGMYGEQYRSLIEQVALEADRRQYGTSERFSLLYRTMQAGLEQAGG